MLTDQPEHAGWGRVGSEGGEDTSLAVARLNATAHTQLDDEQAFTRGNRSPDI